MMMKMMLSLAVAATCLLYGSLAAPLNLHFVPHSHDDVGWLKTVDQYYYGANMSIQNAGVQYILDSVIDGLIENPDRKFIYVEIGFFWRWWNEQTADLQNTVRGLVKQGRLEFINGGWCMNDEATTHYEAIIDQMTLGHLFLLEEFGIQPKAAWHIDPFGHSASQAALHAKSGFDSFFFARIDYQDYNVRAPQKRLEMVWRGSKSWGKSADIFTGALFTSTYCWPAESFFEWGAEPVMDDPRLEDYNLDAIALKFVNLAKDEANHFRSNNVMLYLGCDFMYQNGHMQFKNIDKILNYLKQHAAELGVNAFYSTPTQYVNAIHAQNMSDWELKTDDFFPYANDAHSYWTGYFVSRPALKGYVRVTNALLHATQYLYVSSQQNNASALNQIFVLQDAMGIAQHHDAVAGTEKQHVANDYAKRLAIGSEAAHGVISQTVGKLISKSGSVAPQFTFCTLANETNCPATNPLASSNMVSTIVYNPLAWTRTEYVRIPVPTSRITVLSANGTAVPSQVIQSIQGAESPYVIVFAATLQPMAFTTFYLVPTPKAAAKTEATEFRRVGLQGYTVENENLIVNLNGNGALASVKNKKSGVSFEITQDYLFYVANPGDKVSSQPSGAYVFRPATQTPIPYSAAVPTVVVTNGSLFTEVRRYFQSDLSQIIRLYHGQQHLEIEDTVGPINVADKIGKEVITRYTTSLNTAATFYTDANGLEFQTRTRDFRPSWNYSVNEPVSGNYYPMNAAAYIKDTKAGAQFTVLSDRSRNAASITDGQLETMLHRRCLIDDNFGVAEPLNETTQIITTEYLIFDSVERSASVHRPLAQRVAHPFVVAFAEGKDVDSWKSSFNTDFAPLVAALPANVQLLSLVPVSDGIILRLHHIYQVDEDSVLSAPVTINLANVFKNIQIKTVTETTLTANQVLSNLNRLQWNVAGEAASASEALPLDGTTVTISAMDIRTFKITTA